MPGFLVWPTALGARTPSTIPLVAGPPHDSPSPKSRATSEAGSESASGKRRRDVPDHVDDLYDHLRGGGKETPPRPGSVVGSSGGGGAKMPLLTTFTIAKQVSVLSVCFVCLFSGHTPTVTPP